VAGENVAPTSYALGVEIPNLHSINAFCGRYEVAHIAAVQIRPFCHDHQVMEFVLMRRLLAGEAYRCCKRGK
jgi:hypothetical protein